jgi:hydrogenase expression/formation protein HypE
MFISEESASICVLFGLDPLVTLSEGSLIITCPAEKVEAIRGALRKRGIDGFAVGEVKDGDPGLWLKREDEKPRQVIPPEHDPYWKAYSAAMRKKWR